MITYCTEHNLTFGDMFDVCPACAINNKATNERREFIKQAAIAMMTNFDWTLVQSMHDGTFNSSVMFEASCEYAFALWSELDERFTEEDKKDVA